MAQLYSTGPCHVFVGAPGPTGLVYGTTFYLGTAQTKPRISVLRSYKEAMNDLGGQINPVDLTYQGQSAFVSVALSRWNELVYQAAVNRAVGLGPAAQIGTTGIDTFGTLGNLGGLAVHEGVLFHLFLTFPKAANPFYAGAGGQTGNGGPLPLGYHFFAAVVADQDSLDPGTDYLVRMVQFRCTRVIDIPTQTMSLYDHNVVGLPGID